MTELHPASLAKLVRSISILALPYEGQMAWLRSLGLGEPGLADELALELEDGVLLLRQFEDAGWLTPKARQSIIAVDALLVSQGGPGNEHFWRIEALRESSEWERVRGLALSALIAL